MLTLHCISPNRWSTAPLPADGIIGLPTIFAFDNTADDRLSLHNGQLIAEDGTALEGHFSWSEAECAADLGVPHTGPALARAGTQASPTGIGVFKHAQYAAKYPAGYVLEWVPRNVLGSHAGLLAAYAKNPAGAALAPAR